MVKIGCISSGDYGLIKSSPTSSLYVLYIQHGGLGISIKVNMSMFFIRFISCFEIYSDRGVCQSSSILFQFSLQKLITAHGILMAVYRYAL